MRNKVVLSILGICILSAVVFWKYGPRWLNPRPVTLSFAVRNHQAVPIVRRVELNGLGFAKIRASNMSTTGGLPYKNRWNNDLDVTVTWVEMFNEQAWKAQFTVPVEMLSTYGEEGRHAELEIEIGAGGDIDFTTGQAEFLRLIGLNQSSEITDAMIPNLILKEICAERLADDDPRRLELIAGFEDWSVRSGHMKHEQWVRDNPMPSSRCTPDWTLENE